MRTVCVFTSSKSVPFCSILDYFTKSHFKLESPYNFFTFHGIVWPAMDSKETERRRKSRTNFYFNFSIVSENTMIVVIWIHDVIGAWSNLVQQTHMEWLWFSMLLFKKKSILKMSNFDTREKQYERSEDVGKMVNAIWEICDGELVSI